METGPRREALMARLGGMPGATATPVLAPRGRAPMAMMYKVMGNYQVDVPKSRG